MNYRFMMTSIALLATASASAQIYRCEVDGVVAFSDRPCGPDSAPYLSTSGVSFVTPDENLPALAEAAQEFIRQRREQLARRARAERPPSALSPATPAASPQAVYVPWPVSRHTRHPRPHPGKAGPPPVIAGNDRYSPLNGPILGTRRDSWPFEPASPPNDDRRRK